MHPNYAYVLKKSHSLSSGGPILDYGCGRGAVVAAGRAQGLDIVGVDAFYGGNTAKESVVANGLYGTAVFPLTEHGSIPFGANSFALVVSNQVFEHVQDIDSVLSEIFRVLRPGGALLAIFPSREVWREGHCGIPFIHWFHPENRLRYPYMCAMRSLGLGYHKRDKGIAQWSRDFLTWLDRFTIYRSYADLRSSFEKVSPHLMHMEDDYIAFRLRHRGWSWVETIAEMRLIRPIARLICRTLGSMVLIIGKE
jgi:SAM-dependent methyltransferase